MPFLNAKKPRKGFNDLPTLIPIRDYERPNIRFFVEVFLFNKILTFIIV